MMVSGIHVGILGGASNVHTSQNLTNRGLPNDGISHFV